MTEIIKYTYGYQEVEFDARNSKLMVNATEMAKIFDKKVEAFMRNEGAQSFVEACLKSENSRFLGIEKREDLIVSRQKSGTWMHRILALKFAAWLDPNFEVWVYYTIDKIMRSYVVDLDQLDTSERRDILDEMAKEEKIIRDARSRIQNRSAIEYQAIGESEKRLGKLKSRLSKVNQKDTNQLNIFILQKNQSTTTNDSQNKQSNEA